MNFNQYSKEFKTNINLALPVITGLVGHLLVGLIDDIMVGRLGPIHLAATSLGNSLIFIAISLGIGFSFAITPLIAESDGEKDTQKGRLIFHHSMLMMLILGLVLVLFMFLLKPILYHLKQPPEVVELAIPYFEIVALSMFPMLIFQGFKQFADGLSQTKYAMQATVITNVVNIILNFMLIYGMWIFPKMGIIGAAIGTLVSRIVMVVFMYYNLKRRTIFKPYLVKIKREEIQRKLFKKITSIGLPSALQMLFEVGIFTASILLAGTLGAFPQAANQIAIKLAATTFMISIGIGVVTTIRVGNQKGLKQFVDLRRIAISNFLLITLIMFVFSIMFMLLRSYLPLLFTAEVEVIEIATSLLIIAGIFQISDGVQAVVLAALRGLQDVIVPTYITFVAYWVIGFPICYYLGLYTELRTFGIWIGLLVSLTLSAVLLLIRFNYLTKKLICK
ncbi:MAG: MATE family efflux transporter [Flavobacteriaceae bacterium]|nr:MATE family efflux transporter [Flavobacteriaceae bacterium]